MPRTALTVTVLDRSGAAWPSAQAADVANGMYIPSNDGLTILEATNPTGGALNVMIQTPATVDGQAVADRVVSVPAGAGRKIGPFPTNWYNQADGSVYVDPSTSLTFRVYRLPKI